MKRLPPASIISLLLSLLVLLHKTKSSIALKLRNLLSSLSRMPETSVPFSPLPPPLQVYNHPQISIKSNLSAVASLPSCPLSLSELTSLLEATEKQEIFSAPFNLYFSPPKTLYIFFNQSYHSSSIIQFIFPSNSLKSTRLTHHSRSHDLFPTSLSHLPSFLSSLFFLCELSPWKRSFSTHLSNPCSSSRGLSFLLILAQIKCFIFYKFLEIFIFLSGSKTFFLFQLCMKCLSLLSYCKIPYLSLQDTYPLERERERGVII